MPGPNDCQECGMLVEQPGEYHPFALCALVKAIGSRRAPANLAAVIDHARSEDPHTSQRVTEFAEKHRA